MRSDYFHLRHDEVGEIDQPSFCLIFISDQDGFGTRCSNRPMRKVGGKLAWSGHSGLVVVVSCPSIHQVDTRGPPRFSTRHPLVDWPVMVIAGQLVLSCYKWWEGNVQRGNFKFPTAYHRHGLATKWAKYHLLKLTTLVLTKQQSPPKFTYIIKNACIIQILVQKDTCMN